VTLAAGLAEAGYSERHDRSQTRTFSKQFLIRRVLDETACSSRRLFSQLILMEARKCDNRGGMT
jgi:hypothetical protein